MKHNGFSVVELVVGLAVVAMVGAGAYLYYLKTQVPATVLPTYNRTQALDTTPSHYTSTADLDTAVSSVDSTNVDANLDASLQDLDSQAANF